MTSDDVLCGFASKIGLRIGWGDERGVWGRGRERALWEARFGAGQDGAENGNEEISAFLGESVA
jgi:hypothetical protein